MTDANEKAIMEALDLLKSGDKNWTMPFDSFEYKTALTLVGLTLKMFVDDAAGNYTVKRR